MKAYASVLATLLAAIYASDVAAHPGRSFARSGVVVSAPARVIVIVARPAFVSQSFVARPFVRAPFPRTRIVAVPIVFFPPPLVYYVPSAAYYGDPGYYAPPSYPSGSYYVPPVACDPQYQPPPTGPAQPQPPAAQAPQAPDYQYFCPDTRLYYPATAECASGWLKVVPDSGSIR